MKTISLDRSLVEEEVQRLQASPGLQHAESLCLLLRYLVQQSLDKPHEHVKEYQIAVDVFGRSESFDSRIDSTIRVQTSRLRNKLIEYYATLGANDPLLIEIPRGSYAPVFNVRTPAAAPPVLPGPQTSLELHRPQWRGWTWVALILIGVLLGIGCATLFFSRQIPDRSAQSVGDRTDLRAFWTSVLKSPEPPLVVFSNAEFVGRPETGLRYYNPKTDSRDHIEDLYTGVGEVLAIGELSAVFRTLNRQMVVKRSGLLTWDDTRNRDLIFVGSPNENLSLRDLPLSQEFLFRATKENEPRPGDLAIVNQRPRTGEPRLFLATATVPLSEDYALVALEPGLQPGQNVLLLAGTTTMGTEAAAEFVSQNASLSQVRKGLGISAGRPFPPFAAVLHARVARGVPVETKIAVIHSLAK
jgi:hypothetical protein